MNILLSWLEPLIICFQQSIAIFAFAGKVVLPGSFQKIIFIQFLGMLSFRCVIKHHNIFPNMFPLSHITLPLCVKQLIQPSKLLLWHCTFVSLVLLIWVQWLWSWYLYEYMLMSTVAGCKMIKKHHISHFYGSIRNHADLFCRNMHNHDRNCSLDHGKA